MRYFLPLCYLLLTCTACLQQPVPVLKVGLLAPFEGERREQGYHLLPAIRAATPEIVRGHRIEWVILDTRGDPDIAVQRARELLVDPAVLAIVGPLLPEEAEAIAPVVQQAGIAWWPLAPLGAEGMEQWLGSLASELDSSQGWGALAWPSIRRGEISLYADPQLPSDLGEFGAGTAASAWPQDWLVWQATKLAFAAIEAAPALDRAGIRDAARPLDLPPPALYQSDNRTYPGLPLLDFGF
ncbi:MAG: ABC transporter substrate-binding protein [Ardenticatenaceae bacterium]